MLGTTEIDLEKYLLQKRLDNHRQKREEEEKERQAALKKEEELKAQKLKEQQALEEEKLFNQIEKIYSGKKGSSLKKIPQKPIIDYEIPDNTNNEEELRIPLADKIEAAKKNKFANGPEITALEESNVTMNDKID